MLLISPAAVPTCKNWVVNLSAVIEPAVIFPPLIVVVLLLMSPAALPTCKNWVVNLSAVIEPAVIFPPLIVVVPALMSPAAPPTLSFPLRSNLSAAIVPVVTLPPSIVVTLAPKAEFILVKVTNPVKFWNVKGSLITIDFGFRL